LNVSRSQANASSSRPSSRSQLNVSRSQANASSSSRPSASQPNVSSSRTSSRSQLNTISADRSAPKARKVKRQIAAISASLDLREKLSEQLKAEIYECMICCVEVKALDRIWSCDRCFAIFHIHCATRWAETNRLSAAEQASTAGSSPQWRCPGCQFQRTVVPSEYRCFCGKVKQPIGGGGDRLGTPHSCGQTCSKLLQSNSPCGELTPCRHPCSLPCHPGPCPPCHRYLSISCFCGRERAISVRCGVEPSREERSCGGRCNRPLDCGSHVCKDPCHPGPCSPCTVVYRQECYCGKQVRTRDCRRDMDVLLPFSCRQVCGHVFDSCKLEDHACRELCHPFTAKDAFDHQVCAATAKDHQVSPSTARDGLSHHVCPLSPECISHCPCGRTLLSELGSIRQKCTDPVPCCIDSCGKHYQLICGHSNTCQRSCHLGPCYDSKDDIRCTVIEEKVCRCGKERKAIACSSLPDTANELFLCEHVCMVRLDCKKHRCETKCCPRSSGAHPCDRLCGKKLQCQKHLCPRPCHKGQCGPCAFVSDIPYQCSCGETFLVRLHVIY
jgi:transcriptional repressor NF-X1